MSRIARKLGFVRLADIKKQLNFGYSVAKRLDEHREIVEQIQQHTTLLERGYWYTAHLATQDDYLMRLFHLVHDCWPEEAQAGYSPSNGTKVHPIVRSRPSVLGSCQLPERTIAAGQPIDGQANLGADAALQRKRKWQARAWHYSGLLVYLSLVFGGLFLLYTLKSVN